MAFSHLIDHLLDDPGVEHAIAALERQSIVIPDLPVAARAALAAAAISRQSGSVLVAASRGDRAEALASAIAEYLPARSVALWPAPEALPYEQLPFDLETATERAALLDSLSRPTQPEFGPVLVTPAHGLMQIVMPPDVLRASIRVLRVGDRLSQDQLLQWVTEHGYEATPLVQEPGQVARRGSILDLFPPGTDFPVRIDFFGDEIDAIRSFDPHSQRSYDRLREIRLLPPAELPLERLRNAADDLRGLNLDGLRPEVRAGGSLRLSSDRGAWGAAGAYLVVDPPGRGRAWARRIPVHERFSVHVDAEGVLRTDHAIDLGRLPVLRLHYRLDRVD